MLLARAWQEAMIPLVQLEAVLIEPTLCDLIYFFVIQFNIKVEKTLILSIGPPYYGEKDYPVWEIWLLPFLHALR